MTLIAAVPENYRHYPKQAVFRQWIDAGDVLLKFYHLEKAGEPVPAELSASASDLLHKQIADGHFEAGDHGFVILHRCGADFHFLLVSIWRGANECWEAVWYHQGDMAVFAPFDPAYPPAEGGPPRPTFCVWELGIVAHEALAWSRLLASERSDDHIASWRNDIFEGEV